MQFQNSTLSIIEGTRKALIFCTIGISVQDTKSCKVIDLSYTLSVVQRMTNALLLDDKLIEQLADLKNGQSKQLNECAATVMIDRYKSTRIYKESIVMYSCRSTFINSVLIQCVIGEETRYVKVKKSYRTDHVQQTNNEYAHRNRGRMVKNILISQFFC